MDVHHHKIPDALVRLVESGVWPTESPFHQELNPILGADAAHALSPTDDHIALMPPPFHTIADEVRGGNEFWTCGVTNPNEINYENAVIIADFGLGSDSPIILYYGGLGAPSVMYLRWIGNGEHIQHQWVETHATFDDFVVAVGLDRIKS